MMAVSCSVLGASVIMLSCKETILFVVLHARSASSRLLRASSRIARSDDW